MPLCLQPTRVKISKFRVRLITFGVNVGVNEFGVNVSEICLFLCSSFMRFVVVQVFSFLRTV